eukprot:10459658-Karenia_brevis.AAC.1
MGPPFEAFRMQLSDHVLVKVSLGIPMVRSSQDAPIPSWVCKEPSFRRTLEALNGATDFVGTDL